MAFWLLIFAFIGFGVGVTLKAKSFDQKLRYCAETGIRLECNGQLYTVQRVREENNDFSNI